LRFRSAARCAITLFVFFSAALERIPAHPHVEMNFTAALSSFVCHTASFRDRVFSMADSVVINFTPEDESFNNFFGVH
jgi:hypothetical protein